MGMKSTFPEVGAPLHDQDGLIWLDGELVPWRTATVHVLTLHDQRARQHAAERAGFDDALMLDLRGRIAEATTANVLAVIDGKLCTPAPECILSGITRRTVLEIANDTGIPCVEGDLWPADLQRATEVFVTGTAAEVCPVSRLADRQYVPGPVTRAILEAYDRRVGRA